MPTNVKESALGTANATGNLTVKFGGPNTGYTWRVTVTIPTAPGTSTSTLYLTTTPTLPVIGDQPSAIVEVQSGRVLSVKGIRFVPTKAYTAWITGDLVQGPPTGIAPAGPSTLVRVTPVLFQLGSVFFSRRVPLTGAPVSVLAATEHFTKLTSGLLIMGTVLNAFTHRICVGTLPSVVTTNFGAIGAQNGWLKLPIGLCSLVRLLGTTGDFANVFAV